MLYDFYALCFNGSIDKNIRSLQHELRDFLDYGSCFSLPVHYVLPARPIEDSMQPLAMTKLSVCNQWIYISADNTIECEKKLHPSPFPFEQGIPVGKCIYELKLEDIEAYFEKLPIFSMKIRGMAINKLVLETFDDEVWFHNCSYSMSKISAIKLKKGQS